MNKYPCKKCKRIVGYQNNRVTENNQTHFCGIYEWLISFSIEQRYKQNHIMPPNAIMIKFRDWINQIKRERNSRKLDTPDEQLVPPISWKCWNDIANFGYRF